MKSLSWRIVGIVLLGAIAYAITGDYKEMTVITVLFHGIRFFMYYIHERIWERINWGNPVPWGRPSGRGRYRFLKNRRR